MSPCVAVLGWAHAPRVRRGLLRPRSWPPPDADGRLRGRRGGDARVGHLPVRDRLAADQAAPTAGRRRAAARGRGPGRAATAPATPDPAMAERSRGATSAGSSTCDTSIGCRSGSTSARASTATCRPCPTTSAGEMGRLIVAVSAAVEVAAQRRPRPARQVRRRRRPPAPVLLRPPGPDAAAPRLTAARLGGEPPARAAGGRTGPTRSTSRRSCSRASVGPVPAGSELYKGSCTTVR